MIRSVTISLAACAYLATSHGLARADSPNDILATEDRPAVLREGEPRSPRALERLHGMRRWRVGLSVGLLGLGITAPRPPGSVADDIAGIGYGAAMRGDLHYWMDPVWGFAIVLFGSTPWFGDPPAEWIGRASVGFIFRFASTYVLAAAGVSSTFLGSPSFTVGYEISTDVVTIQVPFTVDVVGVPGGVGVGLAVGPMLGFHVEP